MIFLAGRTVVTTKHPRMSTGAGVGGDAVETFDAAEAAAKLAVIYAQIDLLYKEAAVGNRVFRPFYEDDSDEEPVRSLFKNYIELLV